MLQPSHVRLSNPVNGYTTEVKVGFSWTFLFFNLMVPLFRQDVKNFLILAIYWLVVSFIPETQKWVYVLQFLVGWGYAFFYNRIYITERLKKGWVPADEVSRERLRDANFNVK